MTYSPFRFVALQNAENPDSKLIPGRLLEWNEGNLFIEIGANGAWIEKFDINLMNSGRLNNGEDVEMWSLDELGDTFYDDFEKAKKSEGECDYVTFNKYKVKAVSEAEYRMILREWNKLEPSAVEESELVALMSEPDGEPEPGAWDDLKA